ncbi:hypothetical protein ANN_24048 [Periplaneta americana]|uniref:Uncharacterized protein n=1 Tax=Periplaneta americana TaxID=6978 RepID=A0ABQ8S1Z9_PERAM|nr:hypothetical protein ANN_24048 [Periplaneta americana]
MAGLCEGGNEPTGFPFKSHNLSESRTGPNTAGGAGADASSGLQDTAAALDNKHNSEQRERYYATVREAWLQLDPRSRTNTCQ